MRNQEKSAPTASATPMTLIDIATGYWLSQALFVAAKLGIAVCLRTARDRPLSSLRSWRCILTLSTASFEPLRA
ncbi:hypothetical protein BQ8794_50492 [Mesorhizobium prunaredense]|uniref:Uncharacterized protein n=1 Tax=Mesorhizobium prunaredense TaxID=1631249 RepID=A0A1R3VIZ5_9HYPH|nr:hypothetical protein BQ8794_50492 [Mesorhizobium prunaredense]